MVFVQLSEGPFSEGPCVRGSSCPRVHLSEGPLVRGSSCPRVQFAYICIYFGDLFELNLMHVIRKTLHLVVAIFGDIHANILPN